jgi:hypothetical protein
VIVKVTTAVLRWNHQSSICGQKNGKDVWYTLPQEGMMVNDANFITSSVDACSVPNDNLYVSFYYGMDCPNLVHYMTHSYGDDDDCRLNVGLPYDVDTNLYMFVHTKTIRRYKAA